METELSNRHDPLSRQSICLAASILAAAMIVVFGDVMVAGDAKLLSLKGTDVFAQELGRHLFNFGQLAHGNFALWCPVLFCGSPAFGGMQSGLLYPPSILYLCMSVVKAINWSFILHEFLGGMFMYLWLGKQRLHRWACVAGGMMFAFSAPFYLRILAGHLTVNNTIAWIPLVFLAIDGIIATPTLGWLLLGAMAVSMELLAGYPQVLFYTAIAAALYTLCRLHESSRIWKSILYLFLMNVFVLGLTCVQWATGIAAAQETVRSSGVPYVFAASHSLPPENWIMLVCPGAYGDAVHFSYWGRWYYWEVCVYFGVIGAFFSSVGLFHAKRLIVFSIAGVVVVLGILAMGVYSPHFRFFYDHVPGFNMFRANSKFGILAVTFLIFLSAHGLDMLFCDLRRKVVGKLFFGALITCLAVGIAAILIANCPTDRFQTFVKHSLSLAGGDDPVGPQNKADFNSTATIAAARHFLAVEMGKACGFLAGVVLAIGAAWCVPRWRTRMALVVVAILSVELLFFARVMQFSFPPEIVYEPLRSSSLWEPLGGKYFKPVPIPDLNEFFKKNLDGGRILSLDYRNVALLLNGVDDLWGYGPVSAVRRYAEFMAYSQRTNPDELTGYQTFEKPNIRYDMLRCKYTEIQTRSGGTAFVPAPGPTALPRFLLIADWRVDAKRDSVLKAICDRGFDPRTSVILERSPTGWTAPKWSPMDDLRGTIHILEESTDWQDVEVKLDRPAILLETDVYTPNWHVRALPGSSQQTYELIPANYILRGIPLEAGEHRLRIEYRPIAFVVGRWISLVSLVGLIVATVVWAIRRRKRVWQASAR